MDTKNKIPKIQSKRVIAETKKMMKCSKKGIAFEQVDDNLYKWYVRLSEFDPDTTIHKQLKKHSIDYILMEVTIPKDYPFNSPFVRVVRPRFIGSTGFITTGGSLCTDILTPEGWSPCLNIINLMVQLKILIKDALIDEKRKDIVYSLSEAHAHYNRTTKFHKWGR
tara:strand:+ start:1028 stop:1525 length:498 start_codon:yes stop_codon:yes gene_type:complete